MGFGYVLVIQYYGYMGIGQNEPVSSTFQPFAGFILTQPRLYRRSQAFASKRYDPFESRDQLPKSHWVSQNQSKLVEGGKALQAQMS